MLVCYDFHLRICNEEEDLMFDIEPGLFSTGTIVVPTPIKLEQPINWTLSIGLNLVK